MILNSFCFVRRNVLREICFGLFCNFSRKMRITFCFIESEYKVECDSDGPIHCELSGRMRFKFQRNFKHFDLPDIYTKFSSTHILAFKFQQSFVLDSNQRRNSTRHFTHHRQNIEAFQCSIFAAWKRKQKIEQWPLRFLWCRISRKFVHWSTESCDSWCDADT